MTPELTKLNMGCGWKKLDDHWNVDIEKKCNPDQVVDLEQTPWSYEDNFFDMITADNILEHLGQDPKVFTNIMKEMYRVSKHNAEWVICFPHHRCDLAYDDYTHVRALTEKTFRMFDQKVNKESIERRLADSTFGIYHNIDVETFDKKYNMVNFWTQQVDQGLLGHAKLNEYLNTMSNVCESVTLFMRVHKPGRYENVPLV